MSLSGNSTSDKHVDGKTKKEKSVNDTLDEGSVGQRPTTTTIQLSNTSMAPAAATTDDTTVYRRYYDLDNSSNDDDETQEEEEQQQPPNNHEQNLNNILRQARDKELQYLEQMILSQPSSWINNNNNKTNNDGDDDNNSVAQWFMKQLDLAFPTTTQDDNDRRRPYPPLNQTGPIDDHDLPYAYYGHLDRDQLVQDVSFDLREQSQSSIPRLNAKTFAITSWTNVSSEDVMKHIKQEFGIQNIQYIAISEEIGDISRRRHLHIQIIFKEKIDRRKPFLDEITQVRCNYQVTANDIAWNEYIKKGGNYIEFGRFKSTTTRTQQPKQWPSATPSASSASSSSQQQQQSIVPVARTTRATVRVEAERKRQHRMEIYRQAIELAKHNLDDAMDLIQREMIDKFVERGSWFLNIFNYIRLRAQREEDQRGDNLDKEYVWPNSFPNCTPGLREAMNQWIQHHFFRTKRAKCLILIGPTGTGKTSFALSLPGHVNYFQERWNLNIWNDYARYSVYDDIPWDDFENLNYPNKKNLLTQKWKQISVTDKYRATKQINVRQPAIVLLNPEDAGSLLHEPITDAEKNLAAYWKKRAFIYIMGPDEYFYKRQSRKKQQQNDNNNDDDDNQTTPDTSSGETTNSSMSSNEARLGGQYEFDEMIKRFEEKHSKK